jgi:hypothetical protein
MAVIALAGVWSTLPDVVEADPAEMMRRIQCEK